MGMYDAWAVYSSTSTPYFLGRTHGSYSCAYNPIALPADIQAAREMAISYAAYRLIKHRFASSPGKIATYSNIDALMQSLGYDINMTSTDYENQGAAALGNYIAQEIINFGFSDGANEVGGYGNLYYTPVNSPLIVKQAGNPTMTDPNRWQPLALDLLVDQAGNVLPNKIQTCLSPEWGNVYPFSLTNADKTVNMRNGNIYNTYYTPAPPPTMVLPTGGGTTEEYIWNHTLVANWSSHLTAGDTTTWDISPATVGNTGDLPTSFVEYKAFYDTYNGGVTQYGRTVNPKTGLPYAPQRVKRGDYTRVLAEFWADGPSSETPPGHWFTILNYVSDQPVFEKRWRGSGPILDDLEWDIRSYFALGGALHDVAITCWGIKGWFDYTRPLSSIRYMAARGQSTETFATDYSPLGLPLMPGFVERVTATDPLAAGGTNIGKIKIKAWRGTSYISNPATDTAGVAWILAEKWEPFQKATFVTPPFAGYMSGHSTYSRAAAEVMTLITGDEYFPNGMAEFHAYQNNYLTLEKGPSQDIILQWATYRDASDQCSLSRIWGGIHPPCDDIPGRKIGKIVGPKALEYAETFIDKNGLPDVVKIIPSTDTITTNQAGVGTFSIIIRYECDMDTTIAPNYTFVNQDPLVHTLTPNTILTKWLNKYEYCIYFDVSALSQDILMNIGIQVDGASDTANHSQAAYSETEVFAINLGESFPVTLSSFKAEEKDCDMVISFTTESESNAAYFEVERSRDRYSWQTIGRVRAAGNSQSTQYYKIVDTQPNLVNYYRLKQVDADNTTMYFQSILSTTETSCNKLVGIVGVYPNPVTKSNLLNIKHTALENTSNLQLVVYDILGRAVIHQNITKYVTTLSLDITQLQAGHYTVQLLSDEVYSPPVKFVVE
jgi:hypothetical protein